jgi:hypothetical protein
MRVSQKNETTERWGIHEVALQGPREADKTAGAATVSGRSRRAFNPFTDAAFSARFSKGKRSISVKGFYDGEGVYRIRFSPDQTGRWTWKTASNIGELNGVEGSFECVRPGPHNHGPVHVDKQHHFSFADGTPFFPLGTTAYAWTYRPENIRRQTLESFSTYGFNKIRMLVFPKHYGDGKNVDVSYDPPCFPFEGSPGAWDRTRLVPEYFRNFEARVGELRDRGIQADVILFHFYDFSRWGLDFGATSKDDVRYLDYLVARLASYRNVWWSLASEYDCIGRKGPLFPDHSDLKDWDWIGRFLARNDPYDHPRSIHQWPFGPIFPNRPWLTHVSYQHPNTYSLLMDLRRLYGKPVIDDEYQYEGNLPMDWGNCSAEEEVLRHWAAVMAGGYATHGEAFNTRTNKRDIFWSYGGRMRGGSPQRLKFIKDLVTSLPFQDMEPDTYKGDGRNLFCLSKGSEVYLYLMTPQWKDHDMLYVGPIEGGVFSYTATIWDAWECRKVGTAEWPCGMARPVRMPRLAAIVLRRKGR